MQHPPQLVYDLLPHSTIASPHEPEHHALDHTGAQSRTGQFLLVGAELQRQWKGQGNRESDCREDQLEVIRDEGKEGAPP